MPPPGRSSGPRTEEEASGGRGWGLQCPEQARKHPLRVPSALLGAGTVSLGQVRGWVSTRQAPPGGGLSPSRAQVSTAQTSLTPQRLLAEQGWKPLQTWYPPENSAPPGTALPPRTAHASVSL